MIANEAFPSDVPGVRLQDALTVMAPERRQRLVGRELLGALQLLRGASAASDVSVIEQLLDFERIVGAPDLLLSLLDCLPSHKLNELTNRLGVDPRSEEAAGDRTLGRAIAAFFGKELDFEVRSPTQPDLVKATTEYALFPHQRDVALKAIDALQDRRVPKPAALLHMPTGSGKTRTASHIVCRHLTANQRGVVVWYANTRELLEQSAAELEVAWSHLGDRDIDIVRFWGSGGTVPRDLKDGIVVAGLQKMWALIERDPSSLNSLTNQVSLVVVDEAHISLAETYRGCINFVRRKPGAAVLGLTATPGRTWNEPAVDAALVEMYGGNKITLEVVGYPDPVEYLMSSGYLARPVFELIDVYGDPAEATFDSDLSNVDEDYTSEIVSQVAESAAYLNGVTLAVHRLIDEGHRRVIVFAASVHQAEQIASLLRATQLGAETVTGKTPAARRAGVIQRFKAPGNKPRALVNYGVLTTGFDAPATSAAVIARPTRSLVLYSQMVGRSIRGPKAGGNAEAKVLTVVDPELPGFGSVAAAFKNWEDVW